MVTYTQNKNLTQQEYNDPSWNVPNNLNFTNLDAAFGGQASINVTAVGTSPVALTSAQYINMSVAFSGVLSNNVNYQIPAGVKGQWVIINASTGAFSLTISSATGGGSYVVMAVPMIRSVYCDGTNVVYADSQVPINLATDVIGVLPSANGGIAPGAIMNYAMSSPPTGWLVCDGAAVSRAVYSSLFSNIGVLWGAGDGSTTFNVPDLRGVFTRGWDNGRGLDPGRAFASYQADTYASHNHGVNDPGHSHTFKDNSVGGYNGSNSNTGTGRNYGFNTPTPPDESTTTNVTGIVIAASGDTETRPKNIALLYCIKY